MRTSAPSYSSGPSELPLLGDTIGANFDRIADRFSDRDGLVDEVSARVMPHVVGEELMAWIKIRPGADPLDAAAVEQFCTGKLARFKIPRYVHIVDEFPMPVTGKIRKVEMREQSMRFLARS